MSDNFTVTTHGSECLTLNILLQDYEANPLGSAAVGKNITTEPRDVPRIRRALTPLIIIYCPQDLFLFLDTCFERQLRCVFIFSHLASGMICVMDTYYTSNKNTEDEHTT